nr:reverse transcriptase domain-containing protein [Tanacetum cinerariifolium]
HHLESNGQMCMFALTVSRIEPKNIKEALADSACIESLQEELHQFDRLDMDVKTTFLYGPLREEVYVNQPGAAQTWLEKEPPRSIHTWEDLVSKFVNYFFPPSKTTNLKNDITKFQQRNKPIASKVSTATSSPSHSLDVTALTEIVKELVLMNKATQQATVKAIEETCVTCGGPHPYYVCLATGVNTFDAYAALGPYNQRGNGYRPQGDPNYRASNQMGPLGFPPSNV